MTGSGREGVVLSLVNNKGGVGKTTTAVNLSASLASDGGRVLLVDLDGQGSASRSLGLDREDLYPGVAEAMLEGLSLREAVKGSYIPGLDVLAGSMNLVSTDVFLADVEGREFVLRSALEPALEDYDFIVMDCPTSLGLLTVNALTSSHYIILPVTPDYLGFEGLLNLMEAVDMTREGVGKAAGLLGIVLTLADYRVRVTKDIGEMIRSRFGRLVFNTEIRVNVKLKEAPSHGRSIFDYDGGSRGADDYRRLSAEVQNRIRQDRI
ncbi:MAG: ParA family protein [Thermovirgaceae bacterium]|nr:ParA family protein [Synergistaceae bacterium]NLV65859.1 ParA family protein [Synergistaceae bacterium]HOI82289.1 ParA family protein [Synergistales bacterium]